MTTNQFSHPFGDLTARLPGLALASLCGDTLRETGGPGFKSPKSWGKTWRTPGEKMGYSHNLYNF